MESVSIGDGKMDCFFSSWNLNSNELISWIYTEKSSTWSRINFFYGTRANCGIAILGILLINSFYIETFAEATYIYGLSPLEL